MDCAASITAFRPEPQTLLMVMALTLDGTPALSIAWRAGACPTPPWMTLPMMTSFTSLAGTPDFSSAARIAVAPSSGAESAQTEPRNLPIGGRAADTMTGMRDVSGMKAIDLEGTRA